MKFFGYTGRYKIVTKDGFHTFCAQKLWLGISTWKSLYWSSDKEESRSEGVVKLKKKLEINPEPEEEYGEI
jgi:hypothetical protein